MPIRIKTEFVNLFELNFCTYYFALEVSVASSLHWRQRVGNQRDWVWRGWQTRYTYARSSQPTNSPPLILLHGFGASIGHWRNNLPELAEHHTVYALDMLGFGASEKAAAPYDTAFWAEQVYDFWQTFVRQPVVLVGNSIGSMIALTAAAKYPDMVQGLVMINLPDSSVLESPQWVKQTIASLAVLVNPLIQIGKGIVTSPIIFNTVFNLLRSPRVMRLWAKQAYSSADALTEELLEILSLPTRDRGAAAALRAMIAGTKSASGKDLTAKRFCRVCKFQCCCCGDSKICSCRRNWHRCLSNTIPT